MRLIRGFDAPRFVAYGFQPRDRIHRRGIELGNHHRDTIPERVARLEQEGVLRSLPR